MKLRSVCSGAWEVLAVCRERGDCELLEFLEAPGQRYERDADRMLALLERVAMNGPPRNVDVSHSLQGDVWEFIQGSLRVLWFYGDGRIVVCTHALAKRVGQAGAEDTSAGHRARPEDGGRVQGVARARGGDRR